MKIPQALLTIYAIFGTFLWLILFVIFLSASPYEYEEFMRHINGNIYTRIDYFLDTLIFSGAPPLLLAWILAKRAISTRKAIVYFFFINLFIVFHYCLCVSLAHIGNTYTLKHLLQTTILALGFEVAIVLIVFMKTKK